MLTKDQITEQLAIARAHITELENIRTDVLLELSADHITDPGFGIVDEIARNLQGAIYKLSSLENYLRAEQSKPNEKEKTRC